MNNQLLAYDTETTGLPAYKDPSDAPHQPHLVQLAAQIVDLDTRISTESMNVIIKPDGWIIPDDVAKIHGITTERAMDEGTPEKTALEQFLEMWKVYDDGEIAGYLRRLAFNESFDARLIRIAMKRYGFNDMENASWKDGDALCAMRMAKAHGVTGSKFPKLIEAYEHFLGKPMEGAHSASGDVEGLLAVYFAMEDLKPSETKTALAA
jgi:DNA polymerase III subunit epsilon